MSGGIRKKTGRQFCLFRFLIQLLRRDEEGEPIESANQARKGTVSCAFGVALTRKSSEVGPRDAPAIKSVVAAPLPVAPANNRA